MTHLNIFQFPISQSFNSKNPMWLNPKVTLLALSANARLQVEVSPHTLLNEENYQNKKFCDTTEFPF
jgi:hypothetical protein